MAIVENDFYKNPNVIELAELMIGKVLVTKINGKLTSGIITETEAYNGVIDRASHAFGGRRTARTEIMFNEGGYTYVYLCYGIHHLFNIVTSQKNDPKAVLIRAIKPLSGIKTILERRNAETLKKGLLVGPGKVSMGLGIETTHSGILLNGKKIWLEDDGIKFTKKEILMGPRIGVDYAGKDALLPYRFWVEEK
jgi:DNA-3-methyladenine glycosylase